MRKLKTKIIWRLEALIYDIVSLFFSLLPFSFVSGLGAIIFKVIEKMPLYYNPLNRYGDYYKIMNMDTCEYHIVSSSRFYGNSEKMKSIKRNDTINKLLNDDNIQDI